MELKNNLKIRVFILTPTQRINDVQSTKTKEKTIAQKLKGKKQSPKTKEEKYSVSLNILLQPG